MKTPGQPVAQALLPAAPRLISAHARLLRILDAMHFRVVTPSEPGSSVADDAETSLGAAGRSACATKVLSALLLATPLLAQKISVLPPSVNLTGPEALQQLIVEIHPRLMRIALDAVERQFKRRRPIRTALRHRLQIHPAL